MMARAAKGDKIFGIVRGRNRPRDNVVNIKFLALSGKRALGLSTFSARIIVTRPNRFGQNFPVSAAPVVLRGSALPVGVVFAALSDNIRLHVTPMRAKTARLAVKICKGLPAIFATRLAGPNPAPSGFVVAGHATEAAGVRSRSFCFECCAASLASLCNAIARPAFSALGAFVPRRGAIRSGAIERAILATGAASELRAAFGAGMMNWLCHGESISGMQSKNNYYAIACKRVQEVVNNPPLFTPAPPNPTQDKMDL